MSISAEMSPAVQAAAPVIGAMIVDDPPAGVRGGVSIHVRCPRGFVIAGPLLCEDQIHAEMIAVECLQRQGLHGVLKVFCGPRREREPDVFVSKPFQESATMTTTTTTKRRTKSAGAKASGGRRKLRVDRGHSNGHAPGPAPSSGPIAKPTEVPLDAIVVTSNARETFEPEALQKLADSIGRIGILEPLVVREMPDDPARYELIAGERRLRAAKIAKLQTVPVREHGCSDADRLLAQFHENELREDFNPIERATAMAAIIDANGWKQKEAATEFGCTQPQISNVIRLLNLPENPWQHWIAAGKLSPTGAVRDLIPYADKRPQVLQCLVDKHATAIDDGGFDLTIHEIRFALKVCTRPVERSRSMPEFHKPDPRECYFACKSNDPAVVKDLDIQTIDFGYRTEERCWNIERFDELNAKPLAEYRKKHKAAADKRKAQSQSWSKTAKPGKDAEKNESLDLQAIEDALTTQLRHELGDWLTGNRRKWAKNLSWLLLYLAATETAEVVSRRMKAIANDATVDAGTKIVEWMSSVPTSDQQTIMADIICHVIRHEERWQPDGLANLRQLAGVASLVGCDLFGELQPDRDVLEQFPESWLRQNVGVEQLNRALDQQPEDLEGVLDWLETDWPAGWLPEEVKALVTA